MDHGSRVFRPVNHQIILQLLVNVEPNQARAMRPNDSFPNTCRSRKRPMYCRSIVLGFEVDIVARYKLGTEYRQAVSGCGHTAGPLSIGCARAIGDEYL